ncbi:hypothetical protein [Streptomyces sp. NBC_01481]|uniref:hypothetical protein n=1 Tax=Streptomyces sp. NBC_01481 TaxID=2975869 RepID=UPI00225923C7|nr:hypothetical protein [Streptomyces sp. NBC_01481]MCX4585962.1 hypothetical protein [Streptomyces sp. NBC_01481]
MAVCAALFGAGAADRASGSYATVTAWQKDSSGWKAQFSTSAGRVGSVHTPVSAGGERHLRLRGDAV